MNHYTYFVELLGSTIYLEIVFNFITKIPIKPKLGKWMCLLGACKSNVMVLNALIDMKNMKQTIKI